MRTLSCLIGFGVMALAFPSSANCPWGTGENPAIKELTSAGIETTFGCPAGIDDPSNEAHAQKLKAFFSTSVETLNQNRPLVSTLRKKDFIRTVRLNYRTIDVADYDKSTRTFSLGSMNNHDMDDDHATIGDIFKLLNSMNSTWDSEFSGIPVIPTSLTFHWNTLSHHERIIDGIKKHKALVAKKLAQYSKFKDVIKVVEVAELNTFNSGVLTIPYDDLLIPGNTGTLMKIYQTLPEEARDRIAFDVLPANIGDFDYPDKFEKPIAEFSKNWDEIRKVAPKIRKIIFYYSPGIQSSDADFKYDADSKVVRFPVGLSGEFFEQKLFDKSLTKLLAL